MNPLVAQLKQIWQSLGVSQRALSRASGHERRSIDFWFAGEHEPKLSGFVDLANTLGYDVVLVPRAERTRKAG